VPITAQEIELALSLAQSVTSLLDGSKSAATIASEISAGITANNTWLIAHGLAPVTAPVVPPASIVTTP
jgi:hypothetical protein